MDTWCLLAAMCAYSNLVLRENEVSDKGITQQKAGLRYFGREKDNKQIIVKIAGNLLFFVQKIELAKQCA